MHRKAGGFEDGPQGFLDGRGSGVEEGDAEDGDDADEFLGGGDVDGAGEDLEAAEGIAEEFVDEDEADVADENEGGIGKDGEFFDEADAGAGDEAEGEDADEDAETDDPEFGTHGDGGDDVVDAEAEVHDFDGDDGGPEAAFVFGVFGAVAVFIACAGEVLAHEVDEVGGTADFEPGVFDDPGGEGEAEAAEEVGADDAEFEGEVFLLAGQMAGHGGDGEGVVHAEQSLDDDQRDDDGYGIKELG